MATAESKKKKSDHNDAEMRPEYDLTKLKFVGRGIYAKRNRSATNNVRRGNRWSERRRRSIK